MGDLPPDASQSLGGRAGLAHEDDGNLSKSPGGPIHPSFSNLRPPGNNPPFHSQLCSIPQPRLDINRVNMDHTNISQQASSQDIPGAPFNMGSLSGALPDYGSEGQNQPASQQALQRTISGASTPALVYQLQQISQYPGQPSNSYPPQTAYGASFPGQYPQGFVAQGAQHGAYPNYPAQQRAAGPGQLPASYQGFQQQPSQYMYYPSPYGQQGQFPPQYSAQAAQQQSLYNRRPSLPSAQMPMVAQPIASTLQGGIYQSPVSATMPGEFGSVGALLPGANPQGTSRAGSEGSVSSIPRGPPRKPKQSGHALWVGNLPPGTTVVDLKDHFSRDATKDIESLFLISKSNCAFVNYRTEASCTAAMHRFHDSRFHGVRLVCRLRRSSAPASGVPTGPSAMSGPRPSSTSPAHSPKLEQEEEQADEITKPPQVDGAEGEDQKSPARVAEKFFIVKSLTLQDLELSVRNGIWATQSHNEETLNKAFESADNVYLIFSANKSGEYFGYARMASPILEDASQIMNEVPKPDVSNTTDVPKSIPTPATEFAPKGRIIDDSARGTIFWEAELSEEEDEAAREREEVVDTEVTAQTWGKPFKIEWVSTNRLPFYRTRGLRNPWNANREVKIARDGTELETSVGKRLVQMFHRLGPSSAIAPGMPMMPGVHPGLGGAQMRPY